MIRRRLGWALWLLAAVCLCFFENNAGTRAVLLASALVPLLSLACAAHAARKCALHLNAPEWIKAGEAVEVRCAVSGPKTLLGCGLDGRIVVANPLTGEETELEFTPAGEGKSSLRLESRHCGSLRIAVEHAAARDWLGLFAFPLRDAPTAQVLVTPRMYDVTVSLPEDAAQAQSEWRPTALRSSASEPDNSDIRAYVPGDPIRQIHWKLSAKTDQLLLREANQPALGGCLLLLETVRGGSDPEAMNAAAEAFLSASAALLAEGRAHRVCWFDGRRSELALLPIETGDDLRDAEEAVLRSASVETGEDVGRRFSACFPDLRAERVFLFSPRADTDAVCLWDRNSVSLILPEAAASGGSPGEIRVISLADDDPHFTL